MAEEELIKLFTQCTTTIRISQPSLASNAKAFATMDATLYYNGCNPLLAPGLHLHPKCCNRTKLDIILAKLGKNNT
eukprot:scaffold10724_cov112-Skeletonema_dohrnii-CCMP3373.AAC.2